MKIFALIGSSGTGKSHRASMVAMETGAQAIIDDGLLIADGRIVAGVSAKREATRMAAVKRAILADPAHAQAVREGLENLHLHSLLILGTSRNMIHHILKALHLEEQAVQWVPIESVSTADERTLAQRIRHDQGKHVIPAPTMEVRKTFSGYLVDPLRFIFRRKGRAVLVVEKSIVRPTYSGLGKFYISDTVITALTAHAVKICPWLLAAHRVTVASTAEGLNIALEVTVAGPGNLFRIMEDVQRQVKQQVEAMTSLNVLVLDVTVRHWKAHPPSPAVTADHTARSSNGEE